MPRLTSTQATDLRTELARLKSRAPSAIPEFNVKRAERIAEIESLLATTEIEPEPEHDPILESVLKRSSGGDRFGR